MMDNLTTLLRRLPWAPERVILCGSAPLAFRGVRDVGDLDLLVAWDVWDEIRRIDEIREEYGRRVYRVPGIDAFETLPRIGGRYEDVRGRCDLFADPGGRCLEWRVLPVRDMIAIKALAPPMPKHVDDIRAAVAFL